MFKVEEALVETSYAFQVGNGLPQKRLGLQNQILQKTTHDFLVKNINPSMKIFEFGCGTGETTKLIANLLNQGNLLAVDKSKEQLECSREFTKEYPNVQYKVLDVVKDAISFKSCYDACFGRYVIEHVQSQDRQQAVKNILSTLKNDGIFLLEEGDLNKIFYNSNNPAVERLAELYKASYAPLNLSLNLVSEIPEILKQNGCKVEVEIVTPKVVTQEHKEIMPMTLLEMAPLFTRYGLFKSPSEEKDLLKQLESMVADESVEIAYTDNHQIKATFNK